MDQFSLTVNLAGSTPRDPLTIYNLAQGFYLAGQRCGLNIEVGPGITQCLVGPSVVNYCLSIELFFKALIQNAGVLPDRTHDLKQLFADVPEADRVAIASGYEAMVSNPSADDLLEQTAQYFQKVRYAHEYGVFAFHETTLGALAKAAYVHASRLSPNPPPMLPLRP